MPEGSRSDLYMLVSAMYENKGDHAKADAFEKKAKADLESN